MNKELTPLEIEKHLKDFVLELEMRKVDEMFINNSFEIIEKELKAFEIIKSFSNYEVIEVQGQWYLLQGNSFLKSPKISITKEQAILLTEVLK